MWNITPAQAKNLLDANQSVVLVDVRSKEEYNISHLPNAIHIPVESFEDYLDTFKSYDTVIVYCNTWNSSAEAVKKAKEYSLSHVSSIVWWMSLWEKEWFEIIKNKSVLPLMRQVFIAAWGLILLWIWLRYFINPYFLLITTFVWGWLMFAWISWICGMTKILAFMPWNKTNAEEKRTDFSSNDGTIIIHQFEDNDLAHYSYAVRSGDHMIVVDPARDTTPYYEYARTHKATIVWVIETHPHADFASSHLEIAQTTWAIIYVSKLVWAEYEHTWFDDGDNITLWTATLRAINTPWHSPDSISIVVEDQKWKQVAVFTGDTLFVWDVWRADLRESVWNIQQQQTELAKAMFYSTREKLMKLQAQTVVLPAHWAWTLCGKWLSNDNYSTIEKEITSNPALQPMSEEEFIVYLTSEQPYIPKYFPISVLHNKKGNKSIEDAYKMIRTISINDVDPKKKVIDTRPSIEYLTHSLPWSINIPLDKQFPTIIGSFYSLDETVYFIVKTYKDFEYLQTYLAKIWYESLSAGVVVLTEEALDPHTLSEHITAHDHCIVDVRSSNTVKNNPIFADEVSIRIPLFELEDRIDELPTNKVLVPFCGWTYQSAIALSIIKVWKPHSTVHKFGDALWEMLPLQ